MKIEHFVNVVVISGLVLATACASKPPVEPVKEKPVAVAPIAKPVVVEKKVPQKVEIVKAAPAEKEVMPPRRIEVHFAYDSAELNASALDVIAQHAEFLIAHPQHVATIEGHADERGSETYNQKLGFERATAIKAALVKKGVDERQLQTTSLGEKRPKVAGSGEGIWQKNRRAAFIYETLNQQLSQPEAAKRPGSEMFASDI